MNKSKVIGITSLILMSCLWGAMGPFAKAAIEGGIHQGVLTSFRLIGCTFLFYFWSLFLPKQHVPLKDLGLMAIAALLGIVGDQGLFIWGLSLTSPIDASVISTLIPVFTFILAIIFLKQKLNLKQVIGITLGLIGAIIMVKSSSSGSTKEGSIIGDLIIILAMFSFASYMAFFANLIKKYRVDVMMKWLFLFSSIYILPLLICNYDNDALSQVTFITWSELSYVIIGGTFLPFLFMCIGQKYFNPEVVGVFHYIQPVVGCTLAVLMGLATYTIDKFVATILIFIAVWLVVQKAKIPERKN